MKKLIKKTLKQKIKLLSIIVSVIIIVQGSTWMSLAGDSVNAQNVISAKDDNLEVIKSAENIGNDNFRINFNVEGEINQKVSPNVDILVMVDASKSMMEPVDLSNPSVKKIDIFKSAMNTFCTDLASNTNLRVSIGKFSCLSDWGVGDKTEDASIVENYTNDLLSIIDSVDVLTNSISSSTATNIEAAYYRIQQMIDDPLYLSSDDSNRVADKTYVILFSDGLPTRWDPIDHDGEVMNSASLLTSAINKATELKNNNSQVGFFGIGLFSENDSVDGSHVMNAISSSNHGYSTENESEITSAFKEIEGAIQSYKNDSLARDVVIKDVIGSEFKLKSENELEASIKSQLTDEIAAGYLKADDINVTVNSTNTSQSVEVKLGTVKTSNIEFYLDVVPKNEYFSATKAPTNRSATLTYKGALDNLDHRINIGNPLVQIEPKEGSVTVQKIIVDKNGNTINDDSDFSICLDGEKEDYYFEVPANGSVTMPFYLRDEGTNIEKIYYYTSNSAMTPMMNKNYIMAGKYRISEICPMNYELYSYEVTSNGLVEKSTDKKIPVTIDKDHRNINIIITNKKINDKYWWDKCKEENKFIYIYDPNFQ